MHVKEGLKINKIELSWPLDKKYFEINFDNSVERVYLMTHEDLMLSSVFVVNNNHKPVRISKDDLELLERIDCSTCDIAYDVRMFGKNVIRYFARDIFIWSNDKDYEYITEHMEVG